MSSSIYLAIFSIFYSVNDSGTSKTELILMWNSGFAEWVNSAIVKSRSVNPILAAMILVISV